MGHLAGVDDAEAIDIPADGIADLVHPPVVVFTESNNAPIESSGGFCHAGFLKSCRSKERVE